MVALMISIMPNTTDFNIYMDFFKRQHVSMCLVLDRKNSFDGAEIYGKNTRFMSRI